MYVCVGTDRIRKTVDLRNYVNEGGPLDLTNQYKHAKTIGTEFSQNTNCLGLSIFVETTAFGHLKNALSNGGGVEHCIVSREDIVAW